MPVQINRGLKKKRLQLQGTPDVLKDLEVPLLGLAAKQEWFYESDY